MNTVRMIALGAQIILFRMGLLALNGYATFTIVWGICMMCFSATVAILLLFDFFGKKRNPIKCKFTMIELVAVVAIVGILASFVVNISKTDKHKAVISQIGGALQLCQAKAMSKQKDMIFEINGKVTTITQVNQDSSTEILDTINLIQEMPAISATFNKYGELEDKTTPFIIESDRIQVKVNSFTGKVSYSLNEN